MSLHGRLVFGLTEVGQSARGRTVLPARAIPGHQTG